MDGDVDLACQKRVFDLLYEARLVARRRGAVAGGLDRDDLCAVCERVGDGVCLGQREGTAARPDAKSCPSRVAQRPRLRVRLMGVTWASLGSAARSPGRSSRVRSKADRDSASSPKSSRSACTYAYVR